MRVKTIYTNKFIPIVIVFVITGSMIIWDYLHGGVPTHHLLAREDLPGLSNWWGLFTIPVLTWISLILVERRQRLQLINNSDSNDSEYLVNFLSALVFGILMSILWLVGYESILQYLILLPIVVALFRPVHFAECLLGFVLGLLYVFGGILPLVFGGVLLLVCLIVNKIIGAGIRMKAINLRRVSE